MLRQMTSNYGGAAYLYNNCYVEAARRCKRLEPRVSQCRGHAERLNLSKLQRQQQTAVLQGGSRTSARHSRSTGQQTRMLLYFVLPWLIAQSAFTATVAAIGEGGSGINATLIDLRLADNDPAGAALLIQQNVAPAVASGTLSTSTTAFCMRLSDHTLVSSVLAACYLYSTLTVVFL